MPRFNPHQMSLGELSAFFADLGVATERPGFYDDPELVKLELEGEDMLSFYARFVSLRDYSRDCLDKARAKITAGANKLYELLRSDGRLGACIDVSMSFSRMLDEVGIWNYAVKGSLGLAFPVDSQEGPFHFWPIDEPDGSGREFGHKWIVAPPFQVIDLTLKLQDYPRPLARLLPDHVMFEQAKVIKPGYEDILCPTAFREAIREGSTPERAVFHY